MTTQHQAPEVKSRARECPFCNSPGEIEGGRRSFNGHCTNRRCDARTQSMGTRLQAITAWNTRSTQPLSLTVDEGLVIARLRELLAKCPALPIAIRPQEHDDWGVIRSLSRNEEGFQPVFARAYSGRYETDIELNAHRRAKTDPTQDTMDLIVEGLNALPALLDRLQSLSLPVDIDRSGLAQEVE